MQYASLSYGQNLMRHERQAKDTGDRARLSRRALDGVAECLPQRRRVGEVELAGQ